MNWTNRIVRQGSIRVSDAAPHPENWRQHTDEQAAALERVLDAVGWVQNVVVSERSGRLLDGHLRLELARRHGETEMPCVFVDLDEREERVILASLDSIAAMAVTDDDKYRELLASLDDESVAVIADLREEAPDGEPGEQSFGVIVDCESEAQQVELLERFAAEGRRVRAMVG